MPNNPARTTGENQSSPGAGSAAAQLLDAVREAAGRAFAIMGHLGPNAHGAPAFLAADLTGALTVLLLTADPTGADEEAAYALVEVRTLDAATPTFGATCRTCHAPLPGWEPQCPVCGADAVGVVPGPEQSADDLLDVVRALAGDGLEVVGAMRREIGDGLVYFARSRAVGVEQLAALRLLAGPAGNAAAYTLDVTPITVAYEPAVGSASAATTMPRPTPVATPLEPEGKICPVCSRTYAADVRFCPDDGSTLRPKSGDKGLVGQILADRYHVSKKLGEGGMGTVYLAEQFKIGRLCAIKVMRDALIDDADAAARFTAEASNACRINHVNVAAIYDFGEATGGITYLAMEYVDGEPLSAALSRERRLSPERAAAMGSQTADALSAAHDLGIVHRDLKPDNIMIARGRDGRDLVKVVDFGIAKAIRTDGRGVTRTGFVLGTPAYMSPEQVLGEPLDGRCDIYSLGCILYECLTGTLPFEKGSGGVQLTRRLAEAPPHPRATNPDVPKTLDAIVVRALARAREERFQSAIELRDALSQTVAPVAPRRGLLGFAGFGFGGRAPAPQSTPPPISAISASQAPHDDPSVQTTPDVTRLRIRAAVTRAQPAMPSPSPAPPKSPHVPRPSLSTSRRAGRGDSTVAVAPRNRLAVPRTQERRWRPLAVLAGVGGSAALVAVALIGVRALSHRHGVSAPPVVRPDTVAVAPAASLPAAPPPSSPASDSGVPTGSAGSPAAAAAAGLASADFARAFRREAASAAASRAMAAAAGASRAEFRVGDSLRRAADAVAADDHESALADLLAARQYWDRVAQAARSRVAASQSTRPSASPPPPPSVPATTAVAARAAGPPAGQSAALQSPAQQPASQQPVSQPPVGQQAGAQPSGGVPVTAPGAAAGAAGAATAATTPASAGGGENAQSRAAAQTVAAYVAALNRRDLEGMKQLYPGMPAASQSGFGDLFAKSTDFSARVVSLSPVTLHGTAADLIATYAIDYYMSSEGKQHAVVRLRATLSQHADGWRIDTLAPP